MLKRVFTAREERRLRVAAALSRLLSTALSEVADNPEIAHLEARPTVKLVGMLTRRLVHCVTILKGIPLAK